MSLAATSSRVAVRLPTLARVARKSGTRAVTTTCASSAETVRKLLPEKPPDFFSSFATRSASSDLAARARLTRRVDRTDAPMRAPRASSPRTTTPSRDDALGGRFRPHANVVVVAFVSLGTIRSGVSIETRF